MKPDEAVTLDVFLHMFCTGGFLNPAEERKHYKEYRNFLFKGDESDADFATAVGRRVRSTRNLWHRIEQDCQLIQDDDETVMKSLFDLSNDSFVMDKFLSGISKVEKDQPKNDSAAFPTWMTREARMKDFNPQRLYLYAAVTGSLVHCTCLHIAASKVNQDSLNFNYKPQMHFNNDCYEHDKFCVEGPLIVRGAEFFTNQIVDKYQSQK
jgi:hypothetical protein